MVTLGSAYTNYIKQKPYHWSTLILASDENIKIKCLLQAILPNYYMPNRPATMGIFQLISLSV